MCNLIDNKLKSLDESCLIYGVAKKYINFFGVDKTITKKGIFLYIESFDIEQDSSEIMNRIDVIFSNWVSAEIVQQNILENGSIEYKILKEFDLVDCFR